jgi:hypothetical protein
VAGAPDGGRSEFGTVGVEMLGFGQRHGEGGKVQPAKADKPTNQTKGPGIETPPGPEVQSRKNARVREKGVYLSANFESDSQLRVFAGMFPLGSKPAILLGWRKRGFLGGCRRKPGEVWFVCGGREDH